MVVWVAAALPPWKRERVVATVRLFVDTLAYGVLVYLVWPSRIQNYFSVGMVPNVGGGAYEVLINTDDADTL